MEYSIAYKVLGDETRLRMINLLHAGPLCVCHIQHILDEPQAKVSKHLALLKKHGFLTSARRNNWTIYQLASPRLPLLKANLPVLQKHLFTTSPYTDDLRKRAKTDTTAAVKNDCCC